MTNSADPDQLASSEAKWSGATLFVKTGHVVFSKRRVNNLSVISWWCPDVTASSKITFRVLPHWNFMPRYMTWYSTQSHYTDNAERQAKEQLVHVPFLKSLVWLGQWSNPPSPDNKSGTLPTCPLGKLLGALRIKMYTCIFHSLLIIICERKLDMTWKQWVFSFSRNQKYILFM